MSTFVAGEVFPLARLGRGSGRHRSPTVATLDPPRITGLIETIATVRPAFVLFEGVALLDAVAATRRAFPRLPLVLDCHNVESAVEAAVRRSRWPRPLRCLSPLVHHAAVRHARRADREALRLVDAVWFCSVEDLAVAGRLSSLPRPHVIPNPIPPWVPQAPDASSPPGDELLFVGHLGYRPNRRAVAELCSSILPRLRRLRSNVRLHVCGRAPSAATARAVEAAGGRLTADPADLVDAYRRAAVVVVPLREGGGTRIKIIEALAFGRPVVATAKAVEGLGLTPGIHYLPAESSRQFATTLAHLLRAREEADSLAARGRTFVNTRFGAPAREAAVRDALASIGVAVS